MGKNLVSQAEILTAWNLWYMVMFLSTPTIEELQTLELPTLIEMLVEETVAYIKLIERDGFSHKSNACKEAIINLQAAIEAKQN